ncbi:hypothetical protein [Streptomyces sp. NPDC055400]
MRPVTRRPARRANASHVRSPLAAPWRARFAPARYARPAFPGMRTGSFGLRLPLAWRQPALMDITVLDGDPGDPYRQ